MNAEGQHADLRDYYENEARLGLRGPLRGRRLELRNEFVDMLGREQRTLVGDFGAGPGRDGEGFQAAGHRFVGVDLAVGNARLAAEAGVWVIPGSVTALPIRSAMFDAGWSMSTLMHLDRDDSRRAVEEMLRTLHIGAPLLIGMWGGEVEDSIFDSHRIKGSRRPFHLRSFDRNRQLLSTVGEVEQAQRWEYASGEDYHVYQLRAG